VAAAVLCGLVVLAGGTVAVDAATDGAVRKLFGFQDSFGIGGDAVNITRRVPSEGEQEWMSGISVGMTLGQNKETTIEIVSSGDDPIFSWYFELGDGNHHFAHAFQTCTSEEEYAWDLYARLNQVYADDYKKGTKQHEAFLAELTKCKEQIGTETGFQKACVQGIQWFTDDLTAGRNVVVESWPAYDPVNRTEDGDLIKLGWSFYRFDLDEWKKETEVSGTLQFVVESCAGVENKMVYTVKSYEPFDCTFRQLNRPE
ncbi:MAG: hypothetical protein IJX95_10870, partial [Lachnospiraceae bacterium]|nr:hypothetical protein [Lachnospiraceae bacterium]